MTNNDELALNGYEISNQLRHLADNEIDSDSFAVVTENYNGSEAEFERPITDLALDAAGFIDALLAERDADKKRIADLNGTIERECEKSRRMASRIAELEARTVSVNAADIINVAEGKNHAPGRMIPIDTLGDYCAAAGIKLEVGE